MLRPKKSNFKIVLPVMLVLLIGLILLTGLVFLFISNIISIIPKYPNILSIAFCMYCAVAVIFIRYCIFWSTYRYFKYKKSQYPKKLITMKALYWESDLSYVALIIATTPFLYYVINMCFTSSDIGNVTLRFYISLVTSVAYILLFATASSFANSAESTKLTDEETKMRYFSNLANKNEYIIPKHSLDEIIKHLNKISLNLSNLNNIVKNVPSKNELVNNVNNIIKEISKPLHR